MLNFFTDFRSSLRLVNLQRPPLCQQATLCLSTSTFCAVLSSVLCLKTTLPASLKVLSRLRVDSLSPTSTLPLDLPTTPKKAPISLPSQGPSTTYQIHRHRLCQPIWKGCPTSEALEVFFVLRFLCSSSALVPFGFSASAKCPTLAILRRGVWYLHDPYQQLSILTTIFSTTFPTVCSTKSINV